MRRRQTFLEAAEEFHKAWAEFLDTLGIEKGAYRFLSWLGSKLNKDKR